MRRHLILENGSVYTGTAFGATTSVAGELVFNTGMTGYQESITDPSYIGQILVFTYPLIGNYGICAEDNEAPTPSASAVIVHEIARRPSNWRMSTTLPAWAAEYGLPGLTDIDTRALTKELRDHGSMKAMLVDEVTPAIKSQLQSLSLPRNQVASHQPVLSPNQSTVTTDLTIAVIDFGAKASIVDALVRRGVKVTVYPPDVTAEQVLAERPDGVLLSNGPGDPASMLASLPLIRRLQAQLPLMGICLGHQLFALANGAKTYKMKFGHRGFNHAVKRLTDGQLAFTAQNHGYAVAQASLAGTDLVVTHEEINDHTIEGLRLKNRPAFSVQFHPDATPGPHDASALFDDFLASVVTEKEQLHA
ncbi:carbamoyl-phosphate synthase pyrimidine-specific small chain [Furfurilactobacillus curtus]|uniref:Carbamoyl phosphate synthase small chain n=2 Tax=Furfurilactobacillus curtus TaxID=1746200 RepID=A0ABQ5JN80_9LACO